MKILKTPLSSWVIYLVNVTAVFIFIYIAFRQLFHLVLPSENYVEQYVLNFSNLQLLLLLGFSLSLIGWIITFMENKIRFISPLSLDWEEKVALVISSILLAIFYNNLFSSLIFWRYPVFVAIFFTFIILIPQIVNLYTQIGYEKIYSLKLFINLIKKLFTKLEK